MITVGDTTNKLSSILFDSFENPEPAATILQYLSTQDGKPLTMRHIKALQELLPQHEIDLQRYHDTNIGWYANGGAKREYLYLQSNPKGYIINAVEIEARNARHFAALHERNRKRTELTRNSHKLNQAARAIHDYLQAKLDYERAVAELGPIQCKIDKEFENEIERSIREAA